MPADAPPPPLRTDRFADFLQRIRQAKDLLSTEGAPVNGAAASAASMAVVWELLFDLLCQSPDLETLGPASTVVQRLTSAANHLLALDLKERERDERKAAVAKTVTEAAPDVPADVLRRIEDQLRLL